MKTCQLCGKEVKRIFKVNNIIEGKLISNDFFNVCRSCRDWIKMRRMDRQ